MAGAGPELRCILFCLQIKKIKKRPYTSVDSFTYTSCIFAVMDE